MGAFKNIHMEQLAMKTAFDAIRSDMSNHLAAGFPLEAYIPARAFSALVENAIDPYELELTPAEIIKAVLAQVCLEALAA